MKKMTCKQLGGACDHEFTASSFNEMARMSKSHGMEMLKAGDQAHIDAMNRMQAMMQSPDQMNDWFNARKKEFEALPEVGG